MSAQPVNIQILGRSLRVNCPPDQQQALTQAAVELERRLQELKDRTNVASTEQLIFIVALNVCHELAQEKQKTQDYADNIGQRIRLLQQTIEQALIERTHNTDKTTARFE